MMWYAWKTWKLNPLYVLRIKINILSQISCGVFSMNFNRITFCKLQLVIYVLKNKETNLFDTSLIKLYWAMLYISSRYIISLKYFGWRQLWYDTIFFLDVGQIYYSFKCSLQQSIHRVISSIQVFRNKLVVIV
jgi:hypothetical protein